MTGVNTSQSNMKTNDKYNMTYNNIMTQNFNIVNIRNGNHDIVPSPKNPVFEVKNKNDFVNIKPLASRE